MSDRKRRRLARFARSAGGEVGVRLAGDAGRHRRRLAAARDRAPARRRRPPAGRRPRAHAARSAAKPSSHWGAPPSRRTTTSDTPSSDGTPSTRSGWNQRTSPSSAGRSSSPERIASSSVSAFEPNRITFPPRALLLGEHRRVPRPSVRRPIRSEQSSHSQPDSVRYHRQQLRRSHAKRSPTCTSRPASRTSGRAAAKNSSARSRSSSRRDGNSPANAPNEAAHEAATLPHSSAVPTRHVSCAVATNGARCPSITAA